LDAAKAEISPGKMLSCAALLGSLRGWLM